MNDPLIITLLVCFFMLLIIIFLLKRIKKIKNNTAKEIEKERQINQNTILKITNDAENKILEASKTATQKVADEKQRSADALQKQKETIEAQRSVLSSKSEKELIIDVLIALNGYASRLDRIETGLGYDKIQKKIDDFSKKIETQINSINDNIEQKLSKMNVVSKLDDIKYDVSLIKNIVSEDCDGIGTKINDIYSSLSYNSDLSELKEKIGNCSGL